MPLKLDIKKVLSARSDRVKSVDFHPTEPWVLAGLYSGTVMIWDYQTQALVRQMEVSNLPIRCAKFVVRRQWIIVGCDDMSVKILNYNTLEKIKSIDNAHTDYIRYICVHPTLPLVLSSSDDMTIKCWDWDKNWQNVAIFDGHSHYVMMVQWNPKDNTSFASASLDRTIKIWGYSPGGGAATGGGSAAHFTLTGHTRGVNCLDYASVGEKPYLVSGGDDKSVRVWDYQTKQCVHVLEGHLGNVSCAMFHPTLPIIITGSEDGACKIWHATTYKLEQSLNYMLERLWSISILKGTNTVALGYDEGTVVVKLGSDDPVVSFNAGKVIWAKGVDIQTLNLKQSDDALTNYAPDGEPISGLHVKEMGACELFPQSISHHPSGRLFAVCGDGEYVIYTAQALRNKSFGSALGFAWSPDGHYATREASGRICIYHNFKEAFSFKPDFHIEEIFSGHLLAVASCDFIVFYDWNEYRVIRRIDVLNVLNVYWSSAESAKFVAIASNDSLFILSHDKEAVAAATAGGADPDEGIEIAFDLYNEVNEVVKSAVWVNDSCFVFINEKAMKLNTLVGGQVEVLSHLDHKCTILGYMPEHSRIYTVDKSLNVCSFELQLPVIQYKAAIVCGDFASAEKLFATLPISVHTKIARFLEAHGYRNEALEISTDVEHKFELALSLNKLDLAAHLIGEMKQNESLEVYHRLIGDKALETGNIPLATNSFIAANDAESLLLIASCTGETRLLERVLTMPKAAPNVDLMARILLGDLDGCVDKLIANGQIFEALLFAKTYCPNKTNLVFPKWKREVLHTINPQLAMYVEAPPDNSTPVQTSPHASTLNGPFITVPGLTTSAVTIPARVDEFSSPVSSPKDTRVSPKTSAPVVAPVVPPVAHVAAVTTGSPVRPSSIPARPASLSGPPSGLAGPPSGLAGPPSGPAGPPSGLVGLPSSLRGPPSVVAGSHGPPSILSGPPSSLIGIPSAVSGPPSSLRGPPGPPSSLRGPPSLSGPPSSLRTVSPPSHPEVHVAVSAPESQRPVPRAPESTNVDDLL